jgi:Helix-turn-helix domain
VADEPINLPIIDIGVYILYSSELVVYVGYSSEGPYSRIASALRSFGKKYSITSIEFRRCADKSEAIALESSLISLLKPAENGRKRARPRTSEQGTVVRLARQAAGLTLAELGRSCGYSAAQVSRYERGITPLTDVAQLRIFSQVLGIPPQKLGLA